jgi:hypothetical protein
MCHLASIGPYTVEVFTRYKAAWGGSSTIIVATGIYVAVTGDPLSRSRWLLIFMLAAIFAQFWHGLMQFEKMQPRFEIRRRDQQFWNLKERRGSFGTGHYFEVFNLSISESLECVRAELVSIEPKPNAIDVLPFPLHIRHLPYSIAETFINPRCSREFDLATGPSHHEQLQQVIMIPGIMGGDRGFTNGVPIPLAGCGKSRSRGWSYKTQSSTIVLCAAQTLSSRRCSATCLRSSGFRRGIL